MSDANVIAVGRLTLLALIMVLLSGCATMTAEECRVADWYRLGEQDGRQGRSVDFLAQRSSDCREAGFAVDSDAWYAGYDLGLRAFCRPENGFRQGREGRSYPSVCPQPLEAEFREAWELGRSLNAAELRLQASELRLSELEQEWYGFKPESREERERQAQMRSEMRRLRLQINEQILDVDRLLALAAARGFPVGLK